MSLKQPLKRRIVIAFFIMTLVVAGTSSISIFIIVQMLEEHFVSQELGENLQDILDSHLAPDEIAKLGKHSKFYTTNASFKLPIPDDFYETKEGFSEVLLRNGKSFYAFKKVIDDEVYLLIKDQTEFEHREQILITEVFIGFISSLVIAWLLGNLLANRILIPVIKLASEVENNDHLNQLGSQTKLHLEYADDEVGQLAAAFDKAFNELNSSLERERLFTSDVSHELRTPLMIIASSCELLLDNKNMPTTLYNKIQRINLANKEIDELVQTFLVLARAPNEEVVGEQTSLLAVAEEQVASWRAKFWEKKIYFELIVKATNSQVYNKILLKTVISNLLRNALHYTEHGEVKLVINNDIFSVEDTGIGVPEEQRQAIFQAFVRGDNSNRGEGLGLGLSIVKRVCSHEGWQVKMISKPTGGSIFTVILQS